MRIDEALKVARDRLTGISERPLLEAEILLAHLLQKDRTFLHAHGDEFLSKEEEEAFFALVSRRSSYEPIEYITKEVSFYGETFLIEPGVLIPRPETELLIDELLKELHGDERICEVGTGSGVIAIMLKKMRPRLQIVATDINKKAIELARKNANRFGVEIDFRHTFMLDGVGDVDVIVSNPPYIAEDYPLEPNVALFEPKEALIGGKEGDEMLKSLIDLFINSKATLLACEMGYDQKERIMRYIDGYDLRVRFYKDYAGFDRGFVMKKGRK